jgi:hypothetical protein
VGQPDGARRSASELGESRRRTAPAPSDASGRGFAALVLMAFVGWIVPAGVAQAAPGRAVLPSSPSSASLSAPSSVDTDGTPGSTVTASVDAAAPGAELNEGLVGTNQPVAGAADLMRPLGVDWARTDMSLDSSYDCATGSWDPSALDGRVAADRAMGGTPELIVDYSPSCMTALGRSLEPPNADGYGPWSALVERAAYHEITEEGVRIFEVWNEPDGTFWYGTLADYLSLYKVTVSAIEKAAASAGVSDVLVGGPALAFGDPAWLGPFLAYVAANALPLGFVSWHYYGNYPGIGPYQEGSYAVPPEVPGVAPYWYNPMTRAQTYGEQVQLVQKMLMAYPKLHPLTVMDEWNIDAGYDRRSDTVYDAAFAAAVLDSVQAAGLDRMDFFDVADGSAGTLGNWGMLFSDLRPKPVYHTFLFWHELAGRVLPVSVSPDQTSSDPVGRIGVVASAGQGGLLHILVYDYAPYDPSGSYGAVDPNPYDHAVSVELAGLKRGRHEYSVQMVDATGVSTTTGSMSGRIGLQMFGESVAMVTVAS